MCGSALADLALNPGSPKLKKICIIPTSQEYVVGFNNILNSKCLRKCPHNKLLDK